MYIPPAFREDRLEVLHELMCAHPLATLVVMGADGLTAGHMPLLLKAGDGESGTLQGHFARANPVWHDFNPDIDALAVFQGPQHYVTPSWYPSKAEHGKVVPTWNYAVVHAHGRLTIFEDTAWLTDHLNALTATQETPRDLPWAVSDAPADYLEKQLKGIVGFEIPIRRLEGKWKMSQNRGEADRRGVVDGLEAERTESAAEVARNIPV
jgi:transcriptional regulator